MTTENTNLWIWRNIRMRIPADWEMLQFARSADEGRCAFADRYRFRLELSWRATAGSPDLERTISDYAAKLLEQTKRPPARLACGPWYGLQCERAGNGGLLPTSEADASDTTRFARFLTELRCVVEVVFLWPDGREQPLEETVLDSVAAEPQHDGRQRWRAFGMDILADSGLALTACRVEPASAEMLFADESSGTAERFARRGMVSEWLKEPVSDWQQRQAPDDAEMTVSTQHDRGHEISRTAGRIRGRGLRGKLSRTAWREAAAWICPADGRLYSVSRTGARPASTDAELFGRRLACCREVAP